MEVKGFDWDDGNFKKCQKHGVSIEEIESVFANAPFIKLDSKHLQVEMRYLAVGKSNKGRYIFLAFTLRELKKSILIRPISARYMHQKEINNYEKQINNR